MFITRLKLVNFIGIQNGLGKSEIEISFPKNKNIITMLSGKNGSGKSTIMSQLTPFKDSFDDRKTLIIPGKEGLKEIDIEHNGHIYKIKHVYGKTASSFISEDDIELNENGGVRTFEEIIQSKFKLSKEYFKVGKIGSNTTNFIQFNTSERKKYISTFVEAVEKYLKAYEVVNKKAKLSNQQIKQISDDLKKLGNILDIEKQIEDNDNNLKETNLIINQTNEDIGRITAEIKNLDDIIKDINYQDEKSILKLKESILLKNKKINENVINKYGNISIEECEEKIKSLTQQLNKKNEEATRISALITSELSNQVAYNNDKTKISAQLGVSDNIDLNEYKNKIQEINQRKKELETKISANPKYFKIIENCGGKALVYIDGFKYFMNTILSNYDVLNSSTIKSGTRNAELFFQPDFGNVFGTYAKHISESIKNNRDLLDTKNKEYSNKSANLTKLDILAKRPKACSIDSCPFIADALKYSNLPEELESLEKIISGIQTSLNTNEEKSEELSDLRVAYSNIAKSFRVLNNRENVIYKYFLSKYGKISQFTKLPINDLQQAKDKLIEETEDAISILNEYSEKKTKAEILISQYEKQLNSEKTKLFFKNELIDLDQKIKESNQKVTSSRQENENITKEIQTLSTNISELETFNNSEKENKVLDEEINNIKNKISTYETNTNLINEKNKKLAELNILLKNKLIDNKNISNAIAEMKAISMTIDQYTKNLENIKKSFNDISAVKDALDPKSGIPLVFIKSYLDGTESIANELLNIAYGGKFEIRFIPTASDFFIQVRSGNNVIEDIKLASQGEISLTTISISLALIERSIGEYNIVYLDEIDGPLDKDNRESFIHIIEKQIEKLGLEQIFVISHNNAFEDCAMNLILLNGNPIDKSNSEYMKNKEIIYDVDGE